MDEEELKQVRKIVREEVREAIIDTVKGIFETVELLLKEAIEH